MMRAADVLHAGFVCLAALTMFFASPDWAHAAAPVQHAFHRGRADAGAQGDLLEGRFGHGMLGSDASLSQATLGQASGKRPPPRPKLH